MKNFVYLRQRRDAVWKFWQPSILPLFLSISIDELLFPDAKLQKIHPPIYWKSLDYKQINPTKVTTTKIDHRQERSCADGCHYTTLIGNEFRVFMDFEHDGLPHATWKDSIEREHSSIKAEESPRLNSNKKQQSLNDGYLNRQELQRYFKSRIERDRLFELDRTSYPNRPMPLSRRPRDALHIDFYQADHLKGSKVEATFKTFYHRKYLVNRNSDEFLPLSFSFNQLPRYLREETLRNLISMAPYAQLDIEIIGHFILHPVRFVCSIRLTIYCVE